MEKQIDEKVLLAKSGWLMLFISLILGVALISKNCRNVWPSCLAV